MADTTADPLDAVIGLLAGTFLDRENLAIPDSKTARLKSRFDKPLLSIVTTNVVVGDSIAEQLVPFERQFQQLQEGELKTDESVGATMVDKLLEEGLVSTNRLLNPALPFRPSTGSPFDLDLIESHYEKYLFQAEPAVSVHEEDAATKQARELLWTVDGEGTEVPSSVYEKYNAISSQIVELEFAILEMSDDRKKEVAEKKLALLNQSLVVEGRKHDVENALETINKASEGQTTFSTILTDWRSRYRGSTISQKFAGNQTYQRTKLVPLKHLVDESTKDGWQSVAIKSAEFEELLKLSAERVCDCSIDELMTAASSIESFEFEYASCSIERGWLSKDMFTARFWKPLANPAPLSDGRGNGVVPLLPFRIFFVRNLSVVAGRLALRDANDVGKKPFAPLLIARPTIKMSATQREALVKTGKFRTSMKVIEQASKDKAAPKENPVKMKTGNDGRMKILRTSAFAPKRLELLVQGNSANKKPPAAAAGLLISPAIRHMTLVNQPGRAGAAALAKRKKRRRIVASQPSTTAVIEISASGAEKKMLRQLTAGFVIGEGRIGQERPINLKVLDESRIRFSRKFVKTRGGAGPIADFTIFIRDAEGKVLDPPIAVSVGSSRRTAKRSLVLEKQTSNLVDLGENLWLYGYASRLIDKCPNPDESLTWE